VIIPAFNEAERLPRTLKRIGEFLEGWGRSYEILVVDDGSEDGTSEAARATPSVTLLRSETNRGKGHAVRRGMLAARGERRLMSDADLSTPIDELPRLDAEMDKGYDVVIASRAVTGAEIAVHQPAYREGFGRLFNRLVQWIALPGLEDTQCGFKLFTAAASQDAFSLGRLDGFSFDVEVLFIARKRGYSVAEIPVKWSHDEKTRVSFAKGGLAFLDLLRIRANDLRGRYAPGTRRTASPL
jgi:dolichyl-phosphate beta-glucosyltransferase